MTERYGMADKVNGRMDGLPYHGVKVEKKVLGVEKSLLKDKGQINM